jgi:cell division protein FtsI/penicillin-binding protein 2
MLAILLVFAVFASATGLRLGYWQVVAADELSAEIPRQSTAAAVERTIRADIVDRAGRLLARTASYDSLDAYPNLIDPDDHATLVDTLDAILGLQAGERERFLAALANRENKYTVLRDSLTYEESEAIAAAIDDELLDGITLTPQESRRYPVGGGQGGTSLAAHVLGFVRADGRGGEGIERYYDEQLTTADPGSLDLASIGGTPGSLADFDPPELELTIDAGLQKQVEKELNHVRIFDRAKSVSAVVMDPKNGAILAAASVPSYDANDFAAVADEDMSLLRNRVFSDQYEPGSVMKIFTVTAALQAGKVTPTTKIRDQVRLQYWDDDIQNADLGSDGLRPVKDHIAESRNVVAAKLARMLAPESTQKAARRLYDFWAQVGMARPTGADITGEAAGRWRNPANITWAALDLGNASFGQGVAATLPQLARGLSTLVNGGYLVQPHLVLNGALAEIEPEPVLGAKYARQAKDILRHVTGSVPRYAERALITGYDIGGKTGTAQIWDVEKKRFKKGRFNHSFIGFVAGRDQTYVIAVRLEEPVPLWRRQGEIPLEIESTELFRMVAQATIDKLGMKKSKDPSAGRPIIGTAAAAAIDPVRNREAVREARQEAKRQERREARATEVAPSGAADGDDVDPASAPHRADGSSP